jgi:FkbM family methyltransferase
MTVYQVPARYVTIALVLALLACVYIIVGDRTLPQHNITQQREMAVMLPHAPSSRLCNACMHECDNTQYAPAPVSYQNPDTPAQPCNCDKPIAAAPVEIQCPPPSPPCPVAAPVAAPAAQCTVIQPQSAVLPHQYSRDTVCSEELRTAQAGEFTKLLKYALTHKQTKGWCFGCFSEESVLPPLNSIRPAKDFVYLDVGANKGQSISSVLGLFTDVSFHFVMELSKKGPACAFDMTVPTVYAVEPGPGNIELLNTLKSRLPKLVGDGIIVAHGALSSSTGTMCMSGSQERGNERAHLQPNSADKSQCASGEWEVSTWTLDDFVQERNIKHIDYMKIDTEGFDSEVIFGGKTTFENKVVDMLSFEYHELGLWRSRSLKSVMEYLDGFGYDMYFIGDYQLYKLNAGCWDKVYEMHQWSNIFAIRHDYPLYDALMQEFHKSSCHNRDLKFVCERLQV